MVINCFTNGFAGQLSTVPGKSPRLIEWIYYQNPFDGITIFEGGHAFEYDPRDIDTRYRVAWLTEAQVEKPHMYAEIEGIADRYDLVVTPSRDLHVRNPGKFKLMTRLGIRTPKELWGGPEFKTKQVAMCMSDKMSCPGHRLRRQVANLFGNRIDVLENYDRVRDLSPYRFVVVIEVSQERDFVTEHLLDTLALGCVPLYWGCPTVDQWVDDRGIIQWGTLEDLGHILGALNQNDYEYRRQFDSRSRFHEYEIPEDWMMEHILAPQLF